MAARPATAARTGLLPPAGGARRRRRGRTRSTVHTAAWRWRACTYSRSRHMLMLPLEEEGKVLPLSSVASRRIASQRGCALFVATPFRPVSMLLYFC